MLDTGQPRRSPPSPTTGSTDFEEVFRRYYGSLVGFFRNRGLSQHAAEDMAQETLASAWRGWDTFRGEASAATWLFTIAGNLWQNSRRDQHALRRQGENLSFDASPDVRREMERRTNERNEESDEDAMLRPILDGQRRRVVQEAILELPPRMRRCLLLHLGGLDHQGIGNALEIEVGTVKSTISQSKSRLVAILRRDHPELFPVEVTDR